jgi:tetratricopeptide (TPR) repeat protein
MPALDKVSVSEASLTLPTYWIKGENPNPVFRSQYGVAHIYPYTLLDDIASTPAEKTYRTLVLENRYLQVTVLPDLGGRVYSVFDKISGREVFYKNPIVKFSPLAIRGAFFSGGVEFSFPVAHAPTTADPVNWEIKENEDGSASISFGGLEHISRLRWMITLTLFPERCALAQDVQLFNPYSLPGRYHYWTNASLDADDRTEFVYPLRRVRSYEFAGTASWPFGRLDLILKDPGLPGMEGVPMWPAERMHETVNFRHQKNMLAQVSIFGRDVSWDFFGAWRHAVDHGYAHFADHRDVAGMKLWSWGNAEVGVVNQSALTDDGSLYAETQCGAMETQLDFAFLLPGRSRAWREWWLPLRQLGGLTCASAEAGARLSFTPAQEDGSLKMFVAVCPARNLGETRVEIRASGRTLLSERAAITPEEPWQATQELPATEIGIGPIQITVVDQAGETVLDYTLERDPDPVEPAPQKESLPAGTSEYFYELGLRHENFDNRELALEAYRTAIELSPRNAEAHFRLGLMVFRAADLERAGVHFRRARLGGLAEANYYLGLLAVLAGNFQIAGRAFSRVPAECELSLPAQLCLGSLALRKGRWQQAARLFESVLSRDPESIPAGLLLGIALRRAGQVKKARRELLKVLEIDPLNQPALREMSLIDETTYRPRLDRLLNDDRQYALDLACFYVETGLLEDACDVLVRPAGDWPYPMVFYLLAWIDQSRKQEDRALAWLAQAQQASPDTCFPSRLEEVLALQFALKTNPNDFKARYYLGNFLYARQRYQEAVEQWVAALPGMERFDVLYRNLGLAAWQREKDNRKAIDLFEKAGQLNPCNQDLYLHLDDLYKAEGLTEKRWQLLQAIEALPEMREDVRKRSILMRVDLGRFEEALEIMQTEKFMPLEMDQSFHNLYVRALMQRAEERIKADRVDKAVADYQAALEYPENLGVGKPTTLSQAKVYYHLGLALEKMGQFPEALAAWHEAASEHHPHGSELYEYVQKALDKLSRYSELGMDFE